MGSEDIESYDFTIILKCHTPGRFSGSTSKENLSSDLLSRFPLATFQRDSFTLLV